MEIKTEHVLTHTITLTQEELELICNVLPENANVYRQMKNTIEIALRRNQGMKNPVD
jgi:hypothetical protein